METNRTVFSMLLVFSIVAVYHAQWFFWCERGWQRRPRRRKAVVYFQRLLAIQTDVFGGIKKMMGFSKW